VPIIETINLTKSYGSQRGIVDVNLSVEAGEAYGFLGPNGAGKTTTIRLLLDLLRPTAGRALVFDQDSVTEAAAIHRRIGYLPGEFALFDRLTGAQTIDYFANLRGGIDRAWQALLVERFDLDPSRRYGEYSKGNKQKVGLVIALQHRPELLLLDEPTAGLDPLVQQTFFGLLRELVAQGHTAFLSSHILSEVEKACDRVAVIRDGRIDRIERVGAIRAALARVVEIRFSEPVSPAEFEAIPGVADVAAIEGGLRMRVSGPMGPLIQAAAAHGAADLTSREPSLEDAFLARYGHLQETTDGRVG
jgi:ABC-2 type transport system ATP-binding protein